MRKIELSETQILALQMKFNEKKHELRRWVYFPTPVRVPFANGYSFFIQGYEYLLLSQIEQVAGWEWGDVPVLFHRDYLFAEDSITPRFYKKGGLYLIRKDAVSFLEKEGVGEPVEIIAKDFDESYLAVLTPPPYKSDRLTPQEIETVLESIGLMAGNFKNKEEAADLISRKLF